MLSRAGPPDPPTACLPTSYLSQSWSQRNPTTQTQGSELKQAFFQLFVFNFFFFLSLPDTFPNLCPSCFPCWMHTGRSSYTHTRVSSVPSLQSPGCLRAKGGGILVSAKSTNKTGWLSKAGWPGKTERWSMEQKKWRVKHLSTLNSVPPHGAST